jgi:hypothetical protein
MGDDEQPGCVGRCDEQRDETVATIAEQPRPVSPEANPQEEFKKLREWVAAHCNTGHSVRDSAVHMARSAIIHRLMKYGPDETLNACSAREVMALLVFVNGCMAEYLMRVAYIRAIIEGDHEVYEHLNTTLFIADHRAWYWQIVEAMLGQAPDPQAVTVWLENAKGEELSVARLIICRAYPDLAALTWLDDVPASTPRLAAEIAKVIASDPRKHGAVKAYLRNHPEVRYSVPEGDLP